jgi:hypothetical protein
MDATKSKQDKKIESIETIKHKIENDAYVKTIQMYKDNIPINEAPKTLINIMSAGTNEFKEKTGRQMTYSEMREMYG